MRRRLGHGAVRCIQTTRWGARKRTQFPSQGSEKHYRLTPLLAGLTQLRNITRLLRGNRGITDWGLSDKIDIRKRNSEPFVKSNFKVETTTTSSNLMRDILKPDNMYRTPSTLTVLQVNTNL